MKKKTHLFILFLLCLTGHSAYSQPFEQTHLGSLPQLNLQAGHTVHVLSPEPIRYVDIASAQVAGDLPMENVLRIKLNPDSTHSAKRARELGAITIIGDSFVAQYRLREPSSIPGTDIPARLDIKPEHTHPLEISEVGLSRNQMKNLATRLLTKNVQRPVRRSRDYGMGVILNDIRTIGDYIFLDLSFTNSSTLSYNVDQLRFFIEDKKITKASNVQTVEIEPIWQYAALSRFKKKHRNVFVLKRVTFPGSKVLRVSLTEKQISGRTVNLKIKYRDLLQADTF